MDSTRATELSGLTTILSVDPLDAARSRAATSIRRPEESQNVVPVMSAMTRSRLSSVSRRLAQAALELVMSISLGSGTITGGPADSPAMRFRLSPPLDARYPSSEHKPIPYCTKSEAELDREAPGQALRSGQTLPS